MSKKLSDSRIRRPSVDHCVLDELRDGTQGHDERSLRQSLLSRKATQQLYQHRPLGGLPVYHLLNDDLCHRLRDRPTGELVETLCANTVGDNDRVGGGLSGALL